jgi:signal transduction histidine kinase
VFILTGWPELLHLHFSPLFTILFTLWAILSIVSSLFLSWRFVPLIHDASYRLFYRDLDIALGAIAVGLVAVYVIPLFRLAYIGGYLNLLMMVSPAFPMAILAYYVYRYNFYRLVIKPSLIYSIIYGVVMAIYLLGIRRLGEYLGQFPEVHAEFIEGLLLVALVFAFQPFRSRIQDRLDKVLFKERYYHQQYLRELTETISGIVDLERLLSTISEALINALKARACAIVVFRREEGTVHPIRAVGGHILPHPETIVRALEESRHFGLRRQLRNHRVVSAMRQNRIELSIPIYLKDMMTGLIGLTEKQTGNPYSDEEIDILYTFANQVALAVDNARLVQERLNLEQRVYQAEKYKNMGQLATTIAHEIKNPLSSIKTLIQVLEEGAEGEEADDLGRVVREIDRLNGVLEKLLSFARPAGTTLDSIDLSEMVDDVIALLRHQAEKNAVTISVVQNGPQYQIRARKHAVREILFNLVHNAIQATPRGGTVEVELERQNTTPGRKEAVIISVRDTGPGLPTAVRRKIFDPFFTTKTVGTGLGLTIVKRNIEELGGRLEVSNRDPEGAEFRVHLGRSPETGENGPHGGQDTDRR